MGFLSEFKCGCGRAYRYKQNLKNHILYECNQPPTFFCDICYRGFKRKHHLQRHKIGVHKILNNIRIKK